MIERFLVFIVRVYLTASARFYFNRVEVHGKENLKSGKPILIAANHQNAFMDGLLVAVNNFFPINIMIRADVFNKRWANILLRFLRLMPVYRIRDGRDSLWKNRKQFADCIKFFVKNEAVMLFPEGNHGDKRRLRTLSRGFTKIPFETLAQHPQLDLYIIPVGINYSHLHDFNSSVSIHYGKPIAAAQYFVEPLGLQASLLKDKVSEDLKKLITHIESLEQYDEIYSKLMATNPDFFFPHETNERIRKIESGEILTPTPVKKDTWIEFFLVPLKPFAFFINYPVIWGWRKVKKKVKDPVFVTSLRYGYGISVVQLYYVTIMGVSTIWIGWWALFVYPGLLASLKILRRPR